MAIEKIVVGKKRLDYLKDNLLEESVDVTCEELALKGTCKDFLNDVFGLIDRELKTFSYYNDNDEYIYLLKIFPFIIEALDKEVDIDFSLQEKISNLFKYIKENIINEVFNVIFPTILLTFFFLFISSIYFYYTNI